MNSDIQPIANAFSKGLWSIFPWLVIAILVGAFFGFIFWYLNRKLDRFARNRRKRNRNNY
jgi:uncharacterized protein (DUF2062 family)